MNHYFPPSPPKKAKILSYVVKENIWTRINWSVKEKSHNSFIPFHASNLTPTSSSILTIIHGQVYFNHIYIYNIYVAGGTTTSKITLSILDILLKHSTNTHPSNQPTTYPSIYPHYIHSHTCLHSVKKNRKNLSKKN